MRFVDEIVGQDFYAKIYFDPRYQGYVAKVYSTQVNDLMDIFYDESLDEVKDAANSLIKNYQLQLEQAITSHLGS